jgi:hypothetical protein
LRNVAVTWSARPSPSLSRRKDDTSGTGGPTTTT